MDGSHARPAGSCWRLSRAAAALAGRPRRSPHRRWSRPCCTTRRPLRQARSSTASCRSSPLDATPAGILLGRLDADPGAGGALKATVNDGAAAEGLLDDDDDATGLPAWTPPSSSVPWGTASDLNGGRTPAYMPRPGLRPSPPQPTVAATADPYPADDASAWTGLGSEPAVLAEPGPALPTHPASAPVAQPDVSWPAPGPASPVRGPVAWPEPGAAAAMAAAPSASPTPATAVPAVQAAQVAQAAQPFDGPGAYLPPVPVTLPAGPSAPAREWAGHSAEATGNDAEAVSQTRSAIDADLRVRLLDFVKWLSVQARRSRRSGSFCRGARW